jgi:hypothetical protein
MFERITKIDNSREADGNREKHHRIEITDKEHMEKMEASIKLVYRPPIPEQMSPELKKKFEKAQELTKDMKVKKIKLGNKNERKKSKTSEKRTKKNNPMPNTEAMA